MTGKGDSLQPLYNHIAVEEQLRQCTAQAQIRVAGFAFFDSAQNNGRLLLSFLSQTTQLTCAKT